MAWHSRLSLSGWAHLPMKPSPPAPLPSDGRGWPPRPGEGSSLRRFMVPMRVQNWRSGLSMNTTSVPLAILGMMLLLCGTGAGAERRGTVAGAALRKIEDIVVYEDARFYSAFPSIVT